MKKLYLAFILFLIALVLFFLFPFTIDLISILNLLIFIISIFFAGSSLAKREKGKGFGIALLILGSLSILYLLFNLLFEWFFNPFSNLL